ncbi:hypothetical protein B0O99DRAFT_166285 [Bisporella sp. PMI_857]|nr:hypothetical protein B0O99DRAFT_166285 [Bisporella sp. PMI_857]
MAAISRSPTKYDIINQSINQYERPPAPIACFAAAHFRKIRTISLVNRILTSVNHEFLTFYTVPSEISRVIPRNYAIKETIMSCPDRTTLRRRVKLDALDHLTRNVETHAKDDSFLLPIETCRPIFVQATSTNEPRVVVEHASILKVMPAAEKSNTVKAGYIGTRYIGNLCILE